MAPHLRFAILAVILALSAAFSPQLFKTAAVIVSQDAKSDLYPLISSYFMPEFNALADAKLSTAVSGLSMPSDNSTVSVLVYIDDLLEVHGKTCAVTGAGCAVTCGSGIVISHPEGGSVFASSLENPALPPSISSTIRSNLPGFEGQVVVISGVNGSGVRAALALFLRKLRMLDWTFGNVCEVHAPPPWLHLRGHQLTAWAYDFTPFPNAAFVYLRQLVTFGTNQVELAHFQWTDFFVEKLISYSAQLDAMNVNVSLWFTQDQFSDPGNANQTEYLFSHMQRIDSLFIPGGDGGPVLSPADFIAVVAQIATLLRKYHPNAGVWISAQSYSVANVTDFMQIIADESVRNYLTGVVYGPHVAVSLLEFVSIVPLGYPIRQYPDVCHTLKSQFEVPSWSSTFAFTQGRQVINPMPRLFSNLLAVRSNSSYSRLIGFGSYSEGAAADFNMMLMSYLSSEATMASDNVSTVFPDLSTAVTAYATYFFVNASMNAAVSSIVSHGVSSALFGLEQNWVGHPEDNTNIQATFDTLTAVDAASVAGNVSLSTYNWRFQALLYRSAYDSLLQTRASFESMIVSSTYSGLALAEEVGVTTALSRAQSVLSTPNTDPSLLDYLTVLQNMFSALNASMGLSVMQAQTQDLSISQWNNSISDVTFLSSALNVIANSTANDTVKLGEVDKLVNWEQPPVAGGCYDQLGDIIPSSHPHLNMGEGSWSDPSYYHTPLQAFTGQDNQAAVAAMRLSWRRFVQGLYAYNTTLDYAGLDTETPYTLRIVYFSDGGSGDSATPYRLVANGGYLIHDYMPPPYPMTVLQFSLPASLTADGVLTVQCSQQPGLAGSGRNCQICEVWLYPTPALSL